MITVYTRVNENTITVEQIDVGKEARRVARDKAPKAGATRSIPDKRRAKPKHKKPFRSDD